MKQRLLAILLCLCLIFSGMTVFGASTSGGGGGGMSSGSTVKPFIPNYEYFREPGTYYGFFDQDSLYESGDYIEASLYHSTPDGGMHGSGARIMLSTKVNGITYSTLSQLMAAIPLNVPVQVKVGEVQIGPNSYTDGITEINADATPVTYTGKTYSPSTGTLAGLSADLPIFYCFIENYGGGEIYYNWYYPYLDENHLYDLNVYDYGIVITNMYAKNNQTTLYYIGTETMPNGKMLSNIQVECWPDYNLTGYYGELYNEAGTKLQSKSGVLDEWGGGIITFTDLPAETGTYTIKVWGLSGSTTVTPIYSYEYEKSALESYQGTITKIQDSSNSRDQIARVYVQLDDQNRERQFNCHLPVEVGDTVCNTVSQLMSTMSVGDYVRIAEGGYSYAFQIGAAETAYENYGAISRFQIAYNTVEEYVRVELALPDGTYEEYKIYSGAKMGDEKLEDVNEIYDYLKRNNGVPASFRTDGDEITHFTVGEEGACEDKYDQAYSYSSKAFTSLSAKEQKLPIYYTYNGRFYPTYLDGDHYYDLTVYDHGVVITDMNAKYMSETVKTIECNASGSRNLLLNLGIFCNVTGGTTLAGKLYDANGREIAETSATVSGGEGDLVFEGLPNTDAKYRYLIWAEDRYGSKVSPYYEKDITVKALPSGSGTVQATTVVPGTWNSEEYLALKIKETSGGTVEAQTAEKFFIDGEQYTDTDEMSALLQAGTRIDYIGDAEGKLAAVKRANQETLSYGSIYSYNQLSGVAQISILDKDGVVKTYTMDEYGWLNGHFMGSYSNLDSTLSTANSWHVAYVADGDKLTTLKTGKNSANYAELTYSGGKFSGLPDSAKTLPVYYVLAGAYATPILNESHLYDVTLYDYGIEISNMKAKNMDATICYVEPLAELNSKFFQDVTISVYPVLSKNDTVLKAQLLDSRGYLLAEESREINPNQYQGITFSNRPNQDTDYIVKVWVEDSAGTRISPVYNKKYSIQEVDVTYGTVEEVNPGTDEYGHQCLVLKITIPGLDEPVYVTCPLGTVINGETINHIDDLQAALPPGTLVQIGGTGNVAGNIQIVDSIQNITDVTLNGSSVSANINMVNKTGNTITGTAYTSVYNKDGLLKNITGTPFSIVAGQPNDPVPVNVEGITYAEGDYLKVVCMDENGKPLCNVMKVDI